jgi:hypothetical protein
MSSNNMHDTKDLVTLLLFSRVIVPLMMMVMAMSPRAFICKPEPYSSIASNTPQFPNALQNIATLVFHLARQSKQ